MPGHHFKYLLKHWLEIQSMLFSPPNHYQNFSSANWSLLCCKKSLTKAHLCDRIMKHRWTFTKRHWMITMPTIFRGVAQLVARQFRVDAIGLTLKKIKNPQIPWKHWLFRHSKIPNGSQKMGLTTCLTPYEKSIFLLISGCGSAGRARRSGRNHRFNCKKIVKSPNPLKTLTFLALPKS